MIRRRALMNGEEKNYVGKWVKGKIINTSGSITADSNNSISPYFKVTPGHKIKFDVAGSAQCGIVGYTTADIDLSTSDTAKPWNEYWGQTTRNRTVTLKNNTHFIVFNLGNLYYILNYVQDVTTGEYIWKK